MISPHRRIHKSKSDASTSSIDSLPTGSGSNSPGRGGIFSYFAQARRRLTKSPWETDTLLPTTYSSISATAHTSKRPSPAALTCNHFLMGGHYYPGKDKKRRHLRRRTLWYKLFCSSPPRKAASVLVVLYVLLWHIIVPTVDWIWQAASSTAKHSPSSNWLLFDSTLHIPDFERDQINSVELAAARARLQLEDPQPRLKLLARIVPNWYHRNDPESVHEDATITKETPQKINNGKTDETPKVPIAQDHASEPKQENPVAANKLTVDETTGNNAAGNSRILTMNGEGLTMRTIHTPRTDVTLHSQCPDTDSLEYATTLVTQTTMSRLWILNETCTRWKDPIIAVVFIPQGQQSISPPSSLSLSSSCSNLQIIHYHANAEESEGANYPVNRLRNVGLDAVKTSHVLMMDVDFVPARGLADTIRGALQLQHNKHHHVQQEDQHALVVPAFERLAPTPCETDSDCANFLKTNSSFIPKSFEELQQCVGRKECIVFQSNNNWEGHSTTLSEHWLERQWYQDDDKTTFISIPCFHTARYEPYVVIRWCHSGSPVAPYYDERFHGYGKNKIELVSHLRKQGYQFSILPEGFIVHNPHPESSIKETWNDRKGSELHSSMDNLYAKFLDELDTMYKDVHDRSVKLCKH